MMGIDVNSVLTLIISMGVFFGYLKERLHLRFQMINEKERMKQWENLGKEFQDKEE